VHQGAPTFLDERFGLISELILHAAVGRMPLAGDANATTGVLEQTISRTRFTAWCAGPGRAAVQPASSVLRRRGLAGQHSALDKARDG